jgi:hypothetical protein
MYLIGKINGIDILAMVNNGTDANVMSCILKGMNLARDRFYWRPVGEAMPNRGFPVIVVTSNRIVSEAYWGGGDWWFWDDDHAVNSECNDGTVTHWMPLPLPPPTPEEVEAIIGR